MTPQLFNQVALALFSFVVAGYLVYRFQNYLRDRRHGEKWADFFSRAKEDDQLDKDAFVHMFGRARAIPHWINLVLVFGWSWSLGKFPSLLLPSIFYLVVGLFLTRDIARDARRPDYARLGPSGRLWFNQFYAWTWPLHIFRNTPRKSDKSPNGENRP